MALNSTMRHLAQEAQKKGSAGGSFTRLSDSAGGPPQIGPPGSVGGPPMIGPPGGVGVPSAGRQRRPPMIGPPVSVGPPQIGPPDIVRDILSLPPVHDPRGGSFADPRPALWENVRDKVFNQPWFSTGEVPKTIIASLRHGQMPLLMEAIKRTPKLMELFNPFIPMR